jgi:hypothetical protein
MVPSPANLATTPTFHPSTITFFAPAYQLIDQERLEAIKTEYSKPDYYVEQRVRAVGGLHIYLPIITWILATLFGVIGILVWMTDPSSVGNRAASGDCDIDDPSRR